MRGALPGNAAPSIDSATEAAGRGRGRGGGVGRGRGGRGRTESRGGHGLVSGESTTTAAHTSTTIITTVAGRQESSKLTAAPNDNLKSASHDCSSCLQETIQGAAAVDDGFVLPFSICPASSVGGPHIWVRKSQPPPAASTGK
jgi:hypothetical protein